MKVKNSVYPTDEQMAGFADPGPSGPIDMLNLLKFKPKAEYSDGRDTDLTGQQAYAIYGEGVAKLITRFGGALVFGGEVSRLMLGEVEELWDMVGIARYPSRQAMLDMMMSDEYQAISIHRDAGLAGQLNIETISNGFAPA